MERTRAAVRVAQGVRVVLEDVDLAGKTLFAEPLLGGGQARFQEALARLVMHDQVFDIVALRRGILGMAPGVLIEARAVHEKRVRGPTVGDKPFENVAEDLLNGQVNPAVRRKDQAVFVFKAEDARLHGVARSDLTSVEPIRRNVRPVRVRSRTATSSPSAPSFWFVTVSWASTLIRSASRSEIVGAVHRAFRNVNSASALPPMAATPFSSMILPS